uniref:Uncharacterized protein n=1 Tax=Craspedostauros australis TaxID=1486917 RepID=A0A7R9ZPI0_9STRA|mmetsp:Transcript_5138/g.13819  ORF Transcript_5138/g.13819 Transcript_5138/m.13819 type:complete len:165 (+) Transcript_5138:187-681(+)
MLRKAGSAVSASRSTSDVVDDGEKGSKLRREKEGRTRSIVVLCGMLCFVALAAIAKYNRFTDMRAPPSVRRRRSIVRGVNAAADRRNLEPMDANHINNGDGINENGSGISSNNNNDQEHNGLTIPKFLPPHSIYSQTVDDAQGNPMALNDLHGLITLVVNVACL